MTSLALTTDPRALQDADHLLVVGRMHRLLADDVRALLPALPAGAWDDMVRRGDPGDNGRTATTWTGTSPRRVTAAVLPEVCSRHNAPSRAWAYPHLVKPTSGKLAIAVALDDDAHALASALAVARQLPVYHASGRRTDQQAAVLLLASGPIAVDRLRIAVDATRFAARLVDVPPNLLTTTALVETAREVVARVPGAQVDVIAGPALLEQGLAGLWAVGRASAHPPALVVLDWDPGGARRHLGWVGKGIAYDTGGLSLKSKTAMPGMKVDMAGAAAVLCAFAAAVQLGLPHKLTALLCVAENSVGPTAIRPDDILTLYSGKTVEVNNTDAEGRLVLADGLAWLVRNRAPDEIVDVATLTGAQLVATGKRHAGVYATDEDLERRLVQAGQATGELVHPLPFAPELFRGEFHSPVADMKNSVKDRENAQSSCAGQFLVNHLGDWRGRFAHVDMAGPAVHGGRGTGFGVGLLLALAGVL